MLSNNSKKRQRDSCRSITPGNKDPRETSRNTHLTSVKDVASNILRTAAISTSSYNKAQGFYKNVEGVQSKPAVNVAKGVEDDSPAAPPLRFPLLPFLKPDTKAAIGSIPPKKVLKPKGSKLVINRDNVSWMSSLSITNIPSGNEADSRCQMSSTTIGNVSIRAVPQNVFVCNFCV